MAGKRQLEVPAHIATRFMKIAGAASGFWDFSKAASLRTAQDLQDNRHKKAGLVTRIFLLNRLKQAR